MKTILLAVLFALSLSAQATPYAWGQPMPENCTTTFVWSSPNSYPVHVYKDAACARPWAENAATFWRGIINAVQGRSNG